MLLFLSLPLLFLGLGAQEIIFIVALVLLLFGGKKIPELMKGIGKGVRSFREGMSGSGDEDKASAAREAGEKCSGTAASTALEDKDETSKS